MNVRSAHYGSQQVSRATICETYDVQPSSALTVSHHLQRSIASLRDAETLRNLNARQAEISLALLLKGAFEGDVEVVSGVITECQKHLNNASVVTHFEGHRERVQGYLSSFVGDMEAAAWARALRLVLVTAWSWEAHVEVSICQQGHCQKGEKWLGEHDGIFILRD